MLCMPVNGPAEGMLAITSIGIEYSAGPGRSSKLQV